MVVVVLQLDSPAKVEATMILLQEMPQEVEDELLVEEDVKLVRVVRQWKNSWSTKD